MKKLMGKEFFRKYRRRFSSYIECFWKNSGIFKLFHTLRIEKYSKSLKYLLNHWNYGGILIEFTICMPIVVIVLFFVNDHYRFFELKDRVRASAYMAASLAQQIGNNKTDKALKLNDLARITFASGLNFFTYQTMIDPWPFGMYYGIYWYHIKRNSANSYSYQLYYSLATNKYGSKSINFDGNFGLGKGAVTTKTADQIRSVSNDLICDNDGDERVMMICFYHLWGGRYENAKLGLHLIPLKSSTSLSAAFPPYTTSPFQYKIIFTPKPGRFPVVDN
ncbi:MAG: pilus assembly protein [Alphaproteobacteria bacterium]|nr:pilus assembly protein [Alphaproteobacteria bacterium]